MKIDKVALQKRKLERNEKVRDDYKAMKAKKSKGGSQKYSEAYILEMLAEKYFIARKTVQNILNFHYEKAMNRPVKKKCVDPNQVSIFDVIQNEKIPTVPGQEQQ
jgi:hypothetical protein